MPEDRVKIILKDAEEPSGLAMIFAQYFEQNIGEFSYKNKQAMKTRGKLAIEALEGDVAVTVDFKGGEIEIADGRDPGADIFVRGGIFSLTELAVGGTGALKKLAGGDLTVRSAWKHPLFAARVARFMSLPHEMKARETGRGRPPLWKLAAGVGGAAAVGLAAYFLMN